MVIKKSRRDYIEQRLIDFAVFADDFEDAEITKAYEAFRVAVEKILADG